MSAERLVLGTAQFGIEYGVARSGGLPGADEAFALLDRAVELGLRAFDTAPAYGDAEVWLGRWMRARGLSAELTVTSKLPSLRNVPVAGDGVARAVSRAVQDSCDRLGLGCIADYLLHDASDVMRHGTALTDALAREMECGRIARAGVSAYTPDEAESVLGAPVYARVQHPVNLLDHRLFISGASDRLRRGGVRVEARSVFLQGLLTLDPARLPARAAHAGAHVRSLVELCAKWQMRPVEAALPFVLALPVERAVVGADSPRQLEELVGWAGRALPEGFTDDVKQRFASTPEEVIDPRPWSRPSPRAT